MSYTLYGTSLSPYVRKVLVVAAEKGLEVKSVPINPLDPPAEFLQLSPLGKVPIMVDDDADGDGASAVIPDSSVICDYLEHRSPDPALVPDDPALRARTLWLEEHADSGFVPTIGPAVFQAIVVNQLRGEEPDVERANRCLQEQAPRYLDYYEAELGDDGHFVDGRLTLADIAIASPFVNLQHAGAAVPAARWPKLARFLETTLARGSFSAILEQERQFARPVELAWG